MTVVPTLAEVDEIMPFVAKIPKKVEDLFELSRGQGDPLLVAVLQNGWRLHLSDGPAMNFPSPWPLWFEPYTAPISEVVTWAHDVRVAYLKWLASEHPDLVEHITANMGTSGIGGYIKIDTLVVGEHPRLVFKQRFGKTWESANDYDAAFVFPSPIVRFEPIDERPAKVQA